MSKPFTDSEMEECLALAQTIGHLLNGKDYDVSMTSLCLVLAEGGIQKKDMLTKRQFVASVVETTDSCYEFALKLTEESND
jgi:hypothetical protein